MDVDMMRAPPPPPPPPQQPPPGMNASAAQQLQQQAQHAQQQHQQQQQQQQQQNGTAPVIKRRAPIACRRCRRMRSKCVHDKGKSGPCQSCVEAGIPPENCQFPVRGQPDEDRDFRHPRMRSEKSQKRRDPTKRRSMIDDSPMNSPTSLVRGMPGTPMAVDEWDHLPPLEVIIEAVHTFTRHYFQLGFIHKEAFPERLRTNPRSVSPFFLLGLLSVSARLTPWLIEHYGSAVQAADSFMERASRVALNELYKEPSLERCQGFYLLSIAQQGSGMKYQSSINLGIAVRLATLMQLHREETYTLANPTTPEMIIAAESARRTLWMLHSQDNLHSGPRSPVSLAASDITTLLPCNEAEFANYERPKERAALEDTPPAKESPKLVALKNKSLFATLIQAHYHWGTISRRAFSQDKGRRPWDKASEYAKMEKRLKQWEEELPSDHRWSDILLKGHKQNRQDLAYLGVTMITRLSNIVIRKAYLREMINHDKTDRNHEFWVTMAHELWINVEQLYDQIVTQWADRGEGEGMGGQMAAFCIYSCGFLASYFCKYPQLCSDRAIPYRATAFVSRMLVILEESKGVWPLASGWYEHLNQFHGSAAPPLAVGMGAEHSMADSIDPIPHVLHHPSHSKPLDSPAHESKNGFQSQTPGTSVQPSPPPMHIDPSLRLPPVPHPTLPQQQQPQQQQPHQPPNMSAPSPSQQTVATQVQVQAQQAQQVLAAGRPPDAIGIGLLIEASAFDSHPGTHPAGPGVPAGPPYDPHAAGQGYFPPPAMGASDGYEDQMQTLYIDNIAGAPGGMPNWNLQNMSMGFYYGQPS